MLWNDKRGNLVEFL